MRCPVSQKVSIRLCASTSGNLFFFFEIFWWFLAELKSFKFLIFLSSDFENVSIFAFSVLDYQTNFFFFSLYPHAFSFFVLFFMKFYVIILLIFHPRFLLLIFLFIFYFRILQASEHGCVSWRFWRKIENYFKSCSILSIFLAWKNNFRIIKLALITCRLH